MASGEESLNHAVVGGEQCFHSGRNQYMRHKKREVFNAVVIRLPCGHGIGGSSGLESYGEKHNLFFRILFCKFQRVER